MSVFEYFLTPWPRSTSFDGEAVAMVNFQAGSVLFSYDDIGRGQGVDEFCEKTLVGARGSTKYDGRHVDILKSRNNPDFNMI